MLWDRAADFRNLGLKQESPDNDHVAGRRPKRNRAVTLRSGPTEHNACSGCRRLLYYLRQLEVQNRVASEDGSNGTMRRILI